MALDSFESLPGIIHELQDGGLQINEASSAPVTLILGLASKGVTGTKSPVVRANESENAFGLEGNLVRGMYESLAGGAENLYLLRINAKSAILYGVGTDDQALSPTSIETLLKDGSAADAYSIRYESPSSLGPNATEGRLRVKNALGQTVYDNNPGGQLLNTGEIIVSGSFDAGADIGLVGDDTSFILMRSIAQDAEQVLAEAAGTMAAAGPEQFDLANEDTVAGSYKVYVDGAELINSEFQINVGAGTAGVDQLEVDLGGLLSGGEVITIDYQYDAEPLFDLRDGSDGLDASKMELYEALEEAYLSLENDEIDVVMPQGISLNEKNVADGDVLSLSSDESLLAGRRYPVAGSNGDGLGRLYKEEYQGEMFYFWDIDGDGVAEVWPVGIGAASATTNIAGETLLVTDFREVNFAYQLANFCFSLSVNDNECTGVVGTKGPKSFSAKDISQWVGKEPNIDADGNILADGSGLLGNKFMTGSTSRDRGFFATFSGELPTGADFDTNGDIIRDRNGNKIDIGKYISVTAMPLTFFNSTDSTGFGYQASMSSFYGGYYSALPSNSSPTNKILSGVRGPFRISKAKLNSLAKFHYVSVKQKEDTLRISDAATAATDESDFTRLTTVRIIADVVDAVREIATPYIGEPNTSAARIALETGIVSELSRLQELGFIQRFEAKVSATVAQQIQGDATVELVIVPAFELRKITIITSLAAQ